jgi:hypothetical protein
MLPVRTGGGGAEALGSPWMPAMLPSPSESGADDALEGPSKLPSVAMNEGRRQVQAVRARAT